MNSIGFSTTSGGGEWRENWIFWLLCIARVSLVVILIPILPCIYPTISSAYTPYLSPVAWTKIPLPVVTAIPIANRNLSPVRKMIYAFGVEWDDSTLDSLMQHHDSIDAIIMEELTITGSGLELINPSKFKRTKEYLRNHTPNLPLHILINNHNPVSHIWDSDILYTTFSNTKKRKSLILKLYTFAIQSHLAGINIDFEELDEKTAPYYLLFLEELSKKLHTIGKTVSVDVPLSNTLYDLPVIAKWADLIFLMAYDEHWSDSPPGPIASQDWFARGVRLATRSIPRDKLVITLGNYGYDWPLEIDKAVDLTIPQVQSLIRESMASRILDPTSVNPVFYYLDAAGGDHVVWYLDAATAHDELSLLESLGIENISLWRLGSEDPAIWNIFDTFMKRAK